MALGLMTVYEITPLSSNTHWWAPSKMMEPKAAVENSSTWWEAEPHWQTTVCGGDASFIFKLASMTTCCDSAATWLKHRTVRSKNPKAFTGAEELDIFRCCNWKCWKKKKGGRERESQNSLECCEGCVTHWADGSTVNWDDILKMPAHTLTHFDTLGELWLGSALQQNSSLFQRQTDPGQNYFSEMEMMIVSRWFFFFFFFC